MKGGGGGEEDNYFIVLHPVCVIVIRGFHILRHKLYLYNSSGFCETSMKPPPDDGHMTKIYSLNNYHHYIN
jgi:hypothetical protein